MVKVDFLKLARQAQKIAENKKGDNVIIIDVTGQTEIANYFVIITATSAPQINAISNEIEKTLKYDFGVAPIRRDGSSSQTWKVIDFGGLIVHVMYPDVRFTYNLEKIWNAYDNNPDVKKKKRTAKKSVPVKKTAAKKTAVKKTLKKKTVKKS